MNTIKPDLFMDGLSMASFNILAPQFSQNNAFPQVNSDDLDWDTRLDGIIKAILQMGSSIICLQEATFQTCSQILERLNNDPNPSYKIISEINPSTPHGVATIYNSYRKEVVKNSRYKSTSRIQYIDITIDDATVTMVNCHLKANKENEEIRREQINGILAAEPAIIIGDFNSFPDGSVIAALRAHRYKEYRDYTNYSIDSPYSFTTMKYRGNPIELYKAVSDYIFYRLPGWIVYELRKMPREHEFPTGMPSPTCPSDHLMLYGEFRKLRVEIYNW